MESEPSVGTAAPERAAAEPTEAPAGTAKAAPKASGMATAETTKPSEATKTTGARATREMVAPIGVVLTVVAVEQDANDHKQQQGSYKSEKDSAIMLAVTLVAIFACADGLNHLQSCHQGSIVVALAEGLNHLFVDDVLAEDVGQGPFEPIARQDGHIAIVVLIGLGLDKDNHAILQVLLTHAPRGAYAGAKVHNLTIVEVGGDDHQYLVGGAVVKGHQAVFQGLALFGREHVAIVVHQPVGRFWAPRLLGHGSYRPTEQEDERQNAI